LRSTERSLTRAVLATAVFLAALVLTSGVIEGCRGPSGSATASTGPATP
jgi:hypothetical protein